jgi:hypothetical protein
LRVAVRLFHNKQLAVGGADGQGDAPLRRQRWRADRSAPERSSKPPADAVPQGQAYDAPVLSRVSIRGVPLFAAADDRFLERLAGEFMERAFSAGETIAEECESGRTFIVIESGQVTASSMAALTRARSPAIFDP